MIEETTVSRRSLLHAAGGITFLALLPPMAGAEESEAERVAPGKTLFPVFTALPYLQPGPNSRLVDGSESIVIAWQTDAVPAQFELTYGERGTERTIPVTQSLRTVGYRREKDKRINHVAHLEGLHLGTRYKYRVTMNGKRVVEGFFTTRKPRGAKVRFVSFGDNSNGDISDRAIAYQAYRAMPDFIMNTGDLVYPNGLENQYARFFFPIYNADEAGPRLGAPLLRSVPLYTVLANHDTNADDANGHPCVNLSDDQDALGYYTNLHLPLNGPENLATHTPLAGEAERIDAFRQVAASRFPRMGNYSFDYGDGHFLCLDSNVYIDPTDPALHAWIAQDLSSTDAAWKFVVYHHPAFNVGHEHYDEQHMRALCPLLEKHGVDFVLTGHEHTYQRTRPLKFVATDESRAKAAGEGSRLVPGKFTIDRNFDGVQKTKPDGIVYITTGAGGHILYDPEMNDDPSKRLHPEDNNADYVAEMVTDRHSLTVLDMDAHRVTLRQIDEWGQEIDKVVFSK